MLRLSRLNGQEIVVNLEVVATLESTPDTAITLTNGVRYLVRETIDEVLAKAVDYRRRILAGPVVVTDDGV